MFTLRKTKETPTYRKIWDSHVGRMGDGRRQVQNY